jgi:hypothetical protein
MSDTDQVLPVLLNCDGDETRHSDLESARQAGIAFCESEQVQHRMTELDEYVGVFATFEDEEYVLIEENGYTWDKPTPEELQREVHNHFDPEPRDIPARRRRNRWNREDLPSVLRMRCVQQELYDYIRTRECVNVWANSHIQEEHHGWTPRKARLVRLCVSSGGFDPAANASTLNPSI